MPGGGEFQTLETVKHFLGEIVQINLSDHHIKEGSREMDKK